MSPKHLFAVRLHPLKMNCRWNSRNCISVSEKNEFAPLVFLYELSVHGGLAHQANKKEAG